MVGGQVPNNKYIIIDNNNCHHNDLVQIGATWCRFMRFGACWCSWWGLLPFIVAWCNFVQIGAVYCKLGADWCSLVQLGKVWSKLVEIGAYWFNWYNLVQFGAT